MTIKAQAEIPVFAFALFSSACVTLNYPGSIIATIALVQEYTLPTPGVAGIRKHLPTPVK